MYSFTKTHQSTLYLCSYTVLLKAKIRKSKFISLQILKPIFLKDIIGAYEPFRTFKNKMTL